MVTNINKSTTSTSQTSSITPNPNYSISIEGLKRKFQRVNQEIVKQNVMLQEHLARSRQEQHHVLQENVRLKGHIVALESKLREAEGKSIGDRIEILEVIGEHLIDVTKFLRVLSLEEEDDDKGGEEQKLKDISLINPNPTPTNIRKQKYQKQKQNYPQQAATTHGNFMQSIAEEEDPIPLPPDHDPDPGVFNLTGHISDVSLQDQTVTTVNTNITKNPRKQRRRN